MFKILRALTLIATFAGCATGESGEAAAAPSPSTARDGDALAQQAAGSWYYIKARHSGKCLHQYGATNGNGDPINQWECVDQPNVQWTLVPSPHEGFYYIKVRHSGKCLHQYGATNGNGDPINQWDCIDQPNVQWALIPSPHEGYYYIQARHSGKCVHQYGATNGNGDPINQWDCIDQPNVQWALQPVGEAPTVGPNNSNPDTSVESFVTEGSGCPLGSVTQLSNATAGVAFALNAQRLALPPRGWGVDARTCRLSMTVRVPPGETLAIQRVRYVGRVHVGSEVDLSQELSFAFAGQPLPPTVTASQTIGYFDGPSLLEHVARTQDLTWLPCGTSRTLTITVSETMHSDVQVPSGYTNRDVAPTLSVAFWRKKC